MTWRHWLLFIVRFDTLQSVSVKSYPGNIGIPVKSYPGNIGIPVKSYPGNIGIPVKSPVFPPYFIWQNLGSNSYYWLCNVLLWLTS